MIGRDSTSCLLNPVTGQIFAYTEKYFFPSVFHSVNFHSSMSCSVPDIELADNNVKKELRNVFVGNVQDTLFVHQ